MQKMQFEEGMGMTMTGTDFEWNFLVDLEETEVIEVVVMIVVVELLDEVSIAC